MSIVYNTSVLCCRILKVQKEMENPPFSYFKKRFPCLFIEVYNATKTLNDGKERPALREFFKAESLGEMEVRYALLSNTCSDVVV